MIQPIEVAPREGFRIWIRHADRTSGEINLSPLAGPAVFTARNDQRCFQDVHIAPAGSIAGGRDLERCPDALYPQFTEAPSPGMPAQRCFVNSRQS